MTFNDPDESREKYEAWTAEYKAGRMSAEEYANNLATLRYTAFEIAEEVRMNKPEGKS